MRSLAYQIKDQLGFGQQPLRPLAEHLEGAAQWLLHAQAGTPDDGVAHSYDVREKRWHASYPETTGYVIPTLYDYAEHFDKPEYRDAAYRMAAWEIDVQLEDGSVRAGRMDAPEVRGTIFNTGQVLFGWARAYRESGEERFLRALTRAADWLCDAQEGDGAWRKHPSPFTTAQLNAYNTRTAFGLVRAFEACADERYLECAIHNVEWAIGTAEPNGWLPDNCLTKDGLAHPLTHTIGYAIRGILEVGQCAGRESHIGHALTMARAVAAHQRDDGALPARYDKEWRPTVSWTCITGNSQMAINWLRLADIAAEEHLAACAERASEFNMSIQDLVHADPGIRGGLKGSHPIGGEYMRYRYPNWAAKFFMDGLMLQSLRGRISNVG
jgi:uncharacterized protein YyaL (SSP411 family)